MAALQIRLGFSPPLAVMIIRRFCVPAEQLVQGRESRHEDLGSEGPHFGAKAIRQPLIDGSPTLIEKRGS